MRAAMFAFVWLILTDGRLAHMPAGMAAVAAATWVSLRLLPPAPTRASLIALCGLLGRFLWGSLVAGIDVARRALSPNPPVKPGFIVHSSALPPGPARDAFRALMCLQPGSLPVESEVEDSLLIHCLDTDMPVAEAFAREEARFARALGIEVRHG